MPAYQPLAGTDLYRHLGEDMLRGPRPAKLAEGLPGSVTKRLGGKEVPFMEAGAVSQHGGPKPLGAVFQYFRGSSPRLWQ